MGGSESITLSIINNDKKHDHKIIVIQGYTSFQKSCEDKYKINFFNLNCEKNFFSSLFILISLISITLKLRPDILQSYMYDASKYSRILGLFLRIPVVIYVVNTYERKILTRSIINFFLGFITDKVIVNSLDVKNDVLRYDRISKNKLILINSFATLDYKKETDTNIRKSLGIKKTDFLLLFIARLVKQKGINYLIEAIAICLQSKKKSSLKLIIVGDGPLKNELQLKINNLNLTKNIFLVGEKENLNPYLSEANIYVDSSLWSGLSVSAIKALEASLPLIMTDVGGAKQVTNNGEFGYLCEPANSRALADLISFSYENNVCKNIKSNSYAKLFFSDLPNSKKIIYIYEKILSNR